MNDLQYLKAQLDTYEGHLHLDAHTNVGWSVSLELLLGPLPEEKERRPGCGLFHVEFVSSSDDLREALFHVAAEVWEWLSDTGNRGRLVFFHGEERPPRD